MHESTENGLLPNAGETLKGNGEEDPSRQSTGDGGVLITSPETGVSSGRI